MLESNERGVVRLPMMRRCFARLLVGIALLFDANGILLVGGFYVLVHVIPMWHIAARLS
jgi:hypothetical protein